VNLFDQVKKNVRPSWNLVCRYVAAGEANYMCVVHMIELRGQKVGQKKSFNFR